MYTDFSEPVKIPDREMGMLGYLGKQSEILPPLEVATRAYKGMGEWCRIARLFLQLKGLPGRLVPREKKPVKDTIARRHLEAILSLTKPTENEKVFYIAFLMHRWYSSYLPAEFLRNPSPDGPEALIHTKTKLES